MGHFSSFIIFMIAIAFLLRVDFIFYVIYVCIGVYGWSHWFTRRSLKKLISERIYDDHSFWNEVVPVTVRLHNSGRLTIPWIHISESIAVELKRGESLNQVISLRGRETAEFIYTLQGRRRGYYQIGPLRIVLGDLFGLQRDQQGQLPAEYLTVYPRLTPLTQLGLPSRLPFGTIASRQRLFEDPARPIGIRDFRSGDSMRQINWKVSARTRHLVVKTHQPAITLETAVLLNLNNTEYRRHNRQYRLEWAIEVAASLAAHLIDQRQAVGLMTNGIDPLFVGDNEPQFDEVSGRLLRVSTTALHQNPGDYLPPDISPRNGRAHLIKILERLARVEADATIPFHEWMPGACLNLSWGVTILAITAQGTEIVCQSLHRLVRSGFNPVLITVEPDYHFGQVKERAQRLGFTAYNVADKRDFDPWRRPQQVGNL